MQKPYVTALLLAATLGLAACDSGTQDSMDTDKKSLSEAIEEKSEHATEEVIEKIHEIEEVREEHAEEAQHLLDEVIEESQAAKEKAQAELDDAVDQAKEAIDDAEANLEEANQAE